MTDQNPIKYEDLEAKAGDAEPDDRPNGEESWAILEMLGHRTLVGRVTEVERFGSTFCMIEPIYRGEMLPGVLVGGASIYSLTPITRAVAFARCPTEKYQIPRALLAIIPADLLDRQLPDFSEIDDPDGGFIE